MFTRTRLVFIAILLLALLTACTGHPQSSEPMVMDCQQIDWVERILEVNGTPVHFLINPDYYHEVDEWTLRSLIPESLEGLGSIHLWTVVNAEIN